ncbi:hypothetical protein DFR36_101273 [Melaminivora alkalimesophila]|uniref:Uncharacterized protein n=1 Tax=Melaminivora alkalimesophila TaxID=1165852 RepID=A0A317REX3_9BURK|nr:hypothetical protein [Melaminivora alkalimesophila]PWW48764.1 hypothetical protein DFR36_101273 [Melaminivora alkalimesophila]
MRDEAAPVPPPRLPEGRFSGREAFRQLVRDALAAAAREGWSELVLSDASFVDWPLGERAVVETLQQWARAGRRCTLLALDFDEVVRRQPRFVQWRRQWDHLIGCHKADTRDPLALPSVLWSPGWVLRRLDPLRSNGVSSFDGAQCTLAREQLAEWLERRSRPGFPATVLGL